MRSLRQLNSLCPVFTLITVPDDYNPINQGLFFLPGTTPGSPNAEQCFFFLPTPDQCVEGQEDIVIEANVQFTVTGNQACIYIDDDDGKWSCRLCNLYIWYC